jgi:hypothetical protein
VNGVSWGGVLGTSFWIDPVERLVVFATMMAPEQRLYYRPAAPAGLWRAGWVSTLTLPRKPEAGRNGRGTIRAGVDVPPAAARAIAVSNVRPLVAYRLS